MSNSKFFSIKNAQKLSILIILLIFIPTGYSQEGSSTLPSLTPTEIYIYNSANTNLIILLRPENGNWKNFNHESRVGYTYTNADYIYIVTRDKNVQYKLTHKKRYFLDWNTSKNLWDIWELLPR